MTRENKLALVVGFGLILFIGILISDHFSVARNQSSANLTSREIADPLVARTRNDPDLISVKPEPPITPPLATPDPAVSTSQMANEPQQPIEAMSPEQRSMIDRHATLPQGQQHIAPPRDVQPVNSLNPQSGSAELTTVAVQNGGTIEIPGFVQADEGASINIKDVRFHDVRGGESMFAICKQYYGDTALVEALARFNKMNDPGALREGRRLMIPPPETLGGKAKPVPGRKPAAQPSDSALRQTAVASNTPKPDAKNKKPARTYTVKEGDSLSAIAQRLLGDREKWRELVKINSNVIDDPDNIKAGTILRLS